jgi:hypothetical protein
VVGALGITAVASAIQGAQTVSVSLQSNRAGKPRSVSKITVVTTTTPVPGEPPFATRRAAQLQGRLLLHRQHHEVGNLDGELPPLVGAGRHRTYAIGAGRWPAPYLLTPS